MRRVIGRRWRTALAALVLFVFTATPAGAMTIATELIGVDHLNAMAPNIDGVNDLTGAVQRVAIVDTGLDVDHPGLGGRVVAGVNYAAGGAWGSTSPGAYEDGNGHGTFAAGVIGSNRPDRVGIAPLIEFVAVRVLADDGNGGFLDVARGLEWVARNAANLNITAVNVSIGTSSVFENPQQVTDYTAFKRIEAALDDLESLDIVTAIASGNGGSTTGLSVPAIYEQSISVGATTDADAVWHDTNRNALLDLMAPGASIDSLWMAGGTRNGTGTSFASPMVAGAAVLLRDAYEQFTDDLAGDFPSFQDRVVDVLQQTGTPIYDPDSSRTYFRINVDAAVEAVYAEFGHSVPEPASLGLLLAGTLVCLQRRETA